MVHDEISISHLALEITTFPSSLPLGSFGWPYTLKISNEKWGVSWVTPNIATT